jgi:polar amino acid transport system substrate-binding protein
MMKQLLASLLGILFLNAHAATPIKLCYEDSSVYPWITGDKQGLVIFELQLVEKDLNLEFEYLRLPWKRCLQEVQYGRIQAAIAASYNRDRAVWGSYPMHPDGSLDKELRLHTDSFFIFRRTDSAIRWSNNKMENLGNQVIGAQLGYSVAKSLEDTGYPIKYVPGSDELMRLLDKGMLQVALLQNHEAARILRNTPALEKNIIKESEPVKVADQYLLFNSDYYAKEEILVKTIWQSIGKIRKSKKYLDQESIMLMEETKSK